MNTELDPLSNRLEELVVSKVTEGLNAADQQELDQTDWSSLDNEPELEIEQFERAAAAFAVAFDQATHEPLPADIHQKILTNAKATLADTPMNRVDEALRSPDSSGAETRTKTVENVYAPPSWREGLAPLAMAACLAFMIFNWDVIFESGKTIGPVAELSVDKKMELFVKSSPPDLVDVAWTENTDEDAKGNVVWSNSRQEGYMVFEGLDINDPTVKQYQLWIFEDLDQKYPIDGGVFDISSTGETVIPIDARIPVEQAVRFAITVEDPGGVVVSKRENIPVLADVKST